MNSIKTKKSLAKALGVITSAALISACSDNSDNNTGSVGSSSSTASSNLVETAVAAGSFTTLVSALQGTGLDAALSDPNASLTVFAPTDSAFEDLHAQLGDDAYNALLASDGLSDILLYHVVNSELTSAEVVASDNDFVATLNGKNVVVDVIGNDVMVNSSTVVDLDIEASNGIIHVVDKVIVPPSMTITDLVVAGDDFSTLEAAVIEAGLADTLAGDGPFTVFAPTNAAFDKLGAESINAVLADADLLTNILTYHVISGEVSEATAISLNGQAATMLNGEEATVNVLDASAYIDRAKISVTNILTSNGVVHVIDSVMKPEGVDVPDGDIVDVLSADDNFSTLVTAVAAADLVTTLQGDGPFTVFAPTNEAFAGLPEGALDTLLNDIPALSNILTYHVAAGSIYAADAVAAVGSSVTMVNGSDAAITADDNGLYVSGAKVEMTDIVTSNGVIHVITSVMIPQ